MPSAGSEQPGWALGVEHVEPPCSHQGAAEAQGDLQGKAGGAWDTPFLQHQGKEHYYIPRVILCQGLCCPQTPPHCPYPTGWAPPPHIQPRWLQIVPPSPSPTGCSSSRGAFNCPLPPQEPCKLLKLLLNTKTQVSTTECCIQRTLKKRVRHSNVQKSPVPPLPRCTWPAAGRWQCPQPHAGTWGGTGHLPHTAPSSPPCPGAGGGKAGEQQGQSQSPSPTKGWREPWGQEGP